MLPVLCLSVFLVVVDNTIVNVALPSLSRQLGASTTSLQWIVDAYSLAFAGLLLAGGGIGDRLGRKGVMQVGLVFFGLFSAAAAACRTTGSLIAARALMGVAAAFIFPATLAILTSVFTDHSERQKALGIWGATSGIAVAFGPITGGALLEHYWYGSIFLVNIPIVIVTIISGHFLIPKLDAEVKHRFDIPGVLISTAGVALLVLAIIEGPQWGWLSLGTVGCFALAAVLLAVFTMVELRTEKPLLDVRVFRIPRFTAGALSIAVAFFCLFGFIFLITQYFQFVKGYSTLSAGVHTLPFAIVAAIFTPIGAVAALKIGARYVVGAGLLFMAAGLVMAGFTSTPQAAFFGPIIVSMVLLALGLSLITAPSTEAVMGALAVDQIGAGAAVNNTTRELGGTLGVAVLGSVFASAYAPKIVKAFGPYPIPPAAKQAAHQSMAAALTVVGRAPGAAQPVLRAAAFSGFGAGLKIACMVGAGVAVVGALNAFRFLPGRRGAETAPHDADICGELTETMSPAKIGAASTWTTVSRYDSPVSTMGLGSTWTVMGGGVPPVPVLPPPPLLVQEWVL
ncbi:MAG TPA: DHA2 family efflux MFS transporter permease subunit [Acidimicrobiales bacterium]|jgi:EmrB/QacA subfamily drug resistance transporter